MTRSLIALLLVSGCLFGARPGGLVSAAPAAARVEAPSRSERALLPGRPAGESLRLADPRLERSGSLRWKPFPQAGSPALRATLGSGEVSTRLAAPDRVRRWLIAAGPTSPRAPPVPPA